MTSTVRTMTDAQLARAHRTWSMRVASRTGKLDKVEAIRTSLKPRTRVTPDQKRALMRRWRTSVQQAHATLDRIEAEQRRRRSPLRVRALDEAGEMLGIMEHGGNNLGAGVLAIIKEAGGVGPEPWCGDFVAVAYRRAGSKVVTRPWAAVRYLGFLTGMRVLAGVRRALPGDIVCFTFDHTGLLRYFCDANGRKVAAGIATHVATREGNTGATGAVSDSKTGGDGVYDKVRPIELVARAVRVSR